MKFFALLISIQLFITACSTVAIVGAETSGLSLLHDRRTSLAIANDERIEINAAFTLLLEKDIRSLCHVNVTSYNGTVLVTGESPTEQLRDKIINKVRAVKGVKIVHNELAIAHPTSFLSRTEDTSITVKIKFALGNIKNLSGFDATRIKIITENNTVYLMGIVHKKEGEIAAEIARKENGVKQVVKIFEYIGYSN